MTEPTIKYKFIGKENTSLPGLPARDITEFDLLILSAVDIARIQNSELYAAFVPKTSPKRRKPKKVDDKINVD